MIKFVKNLAMKLKVIIHEAEEGGYWAEVPSIPGCATQGDSMVELIKNLYDAVEGCLNIDMEKIQLENKDTILELAV
jgi:predicted RNase H-like HicB family nuclease